MNKLVVEELLFSHDIKPPYTNVDEWNVKKCKMSFNIRYPIVIFVVYQREKVNYLNNRNPFTFVKVKEGTKVDWPYIMFNNMYSELDTWTKMKEDASGCKTWGQEKDLSFTVGFGSCLNTCFRRNLWLCRKENNKNP